MKPPKTKRVNSWAIVLDYQTLVPPDIFVTEKEARDSLEKRKFKEILKVIPCVITYKI